MVGRNQKSKGNQYKFPENIVQPKRGTCHHYQDDPNLQHTRATMRQITTETEEHPIP